jgi:putative tryptophan/tyrosine transport system substrate-binding protein
VLAIVLVASLPAHPQLAKAVRIGVLTPGSLVTPGTLSNSVYEPFRQGLHELGYVEGQNIVVEVRAAEGHYDRLSDLAVELVHLKSDVIVVDGTMAVVAAKRATTTIPIVMAVAANPVESGLVSSLARPGGNITGNSALSVDLAGKRLALLKEAVPKAQRVAILSNPGAPAHGIILPEGLGAARTLGLLIQHLEVSTAPDLDGAFATALAHHADAIFVLDDPMFRSNRERIVGLAAKSRLPAMYGNRHFVDVGGLMSYGPSLPDLFRRAATYVDKILKGAKPADLPIEQPSKLVLVINLKTAKALGLNLPQSVLVRADQLIQ